MDKQFYTYLHCKPNGDPFYVGKGIGKRSHDLSRRSKWHKAIVAKHGIEILVFKKDSEESAFKSEIRLIKMLRNAGFELANQTDGGEGASGRVWSEEARIKMSNSHIGIKRSPETKALISASKKGHFTSPEARAKMSASRKGKKLSPEHCAKISVANKGIKFSPERCANISAAKKGIPLGTRRETQSKGSLL